MSKKNNRKLRAQTHQYALKKEKEQKEKHERKAERKKQHADALEIMQKLDIGTKSAKKLGVSSSNKIKTKRKGVKLRKNAVVRGIKVKDAESRRQIREILEAEAAMQDE